MGGIALPALHLNPPAAPPNVAEQYGQLLQLKNMMANAPLQRQILQQQAQSGQLDVQQKQIAMKDQQAMSAAMQQWGQPKTPSVTTNTGAVTDPRTGQSLSAGSPVTVTGPAGAPTSSGSMPNYDDLVELARKNGASFNAIKGLQTQILDMKAKAATIAKDDAQAGTANANTMKAKNGMIIDAMNGVVSLPDQQLPQAIMQTAQELAGKGLLDPQHVQMAQQIAQSGDPAKMRQQIDVYTKSLGGFSQMLAEAQKKAQTFEATARGDEAATNTALAPMKLANEQAMRSQGAQRLSIEQAKLNFEQKKAGLASNGAPSDLSTAIAQGHITPDRMGYLLARNPEILQGVLSVDPSFDSAKAQQYPATYKDFTSGKTSVALNAGGTALTHLKELSEMNTDASHIPGTPDYNAYQNKADTVASELAKFYGDATIPAIAAIKKTLTATLPGNRQAAIQTQAQSMGDKLDSFQQTWDNAAPSKAYQAPMPGISQKAIAARAALDPKYSAQAGASGTMQRAPAPTDGTTKTNSHGDKIVFKGGQWQLAQ